MIAKDISYSIDIIRGLACIGVIWGHSVYGFNFPLVLDGHNTYLTITPQNDILF